MQQLIVPVKISASTKYISVPKEQKLRESWMFFIQMTDENLNITKKIFQNEYARVIGHRNNIVVRTGEEACVSAEIGDGAVQSLVPWKFADWHQKSDF